MDVFYGVAGHPVSHSLSPVLINIVAQYVSSQSKTAPKFNLKQTDLVSAEFIQDALAWGYVKSIPAPVNWDLTGAPFGKFRNKALMQKVLEATADITQSIDGLANEMPSKIQANPPLTEYYLKTSTRNGISSQLNTSEIPGGRFQRFIIN